MLTIGTCDCSCIKHQYLPPYRATVWFPFHGFHPYLDGGHTAIPDPPLLWLPVDGPVCLAGPYGGTVTDHYLTLTEVSLHTWEYDWGVDPHSYYGATTTVVRTRDKFGGDTIDTNTVYEADGQYPPGGSPGTLISTLIEWLADSDIEWHSRVTYTYTIPAMGLTVTEIYDNHFTLTDAYTWAEYLGLFDALVAHVPITDLTTEAAKLAACDEWTYVRIPGTTTIFGEPYVRWRISYKVAGVEVDTGFNSHFCTYNSNGTIQHVMGIEAALGGGIGGHYYYWCGPDQQPPGWGPNGARIFYLFIGTTTEIAGYHALSIYPIGVPWYSGPGDPEGYIIRGNTDYILTSDLTEVICNPQASIDTPIHTAASGWLSFEPVQEEILTIAIAP